MLKNRTETKIRKAVEQKHELSMLKARIAALPKEELVKIILTGAEKYPGFKRELMVHFEADSAATLETIRKDISRAFPDMMDEEYSTPEIANQLETILKSVAEAPDAIKVEVYWAAVDHTLRELNEYGMQDFALEELAEETMDGLVACLAGKESLQPRKQAIIEALMKYYVRGNSGVTDQIYDAVEKLCSDKSDYQIVGAALKPKSKGGSYYKEVLANLYEKIDAKKTLRKTFQK